MIAPVGPVLARIASIQSRFGGGSRVGGSPAGRGFAAAYDVASVALEASTPTAASAVASVGETAPSVPTATRLPAMPMTATAVRLPASPFATTATRLAPTSFSAPTATWSTASVGATGAVPHAEAFAASEARYGLPSGLLGAVGWVESRYQPDAVSPAGAVGLMQLMPVVAESLGVDARVPEQAIDGAARLLRSHFDRFGSWELALASYVVGPGTVADAGGSIPAGNAVRYVQKVMERMATT